MLDAYSPTLVFADRTSVARGRTIRAYRVDDIPPDAAKQDPIDLTNSIKALAVATAQTDSNGTVIAPLKLEPGSDYVLITNDDGIGNGGDFDFTAGDKLVLTLYANPPRESMATGDD